jgi:hypothetical protein
MVAPAFEERLRLKRHDIPVNCLFRQRFLCFEPLLMQILRNFFLGSLSYLRKPAQRRPDDDFRALRCGTD